jgi:hypothetical protein
MAVHRTNKVEIERAAAASYLVTMLKELTPIAQRNGLDVVAYLLGVAQLEADSVARQSAERPEHSR